MKKTSPPNTYRAAFNDYTEPHIYMITLTTEYRKPILGQLFHNDNNPHIILTPLGMFVNDELDKIKTIYPQIKIIARQVMPDHIHFIIYVSERIPVHLSKIISGYKAGCNGAYLEFISMTSERSETQQGKSFDACMRLLTQSKPTQKIQLFSAKYHDRILSGKNQLQHMIDYIHDNPRRLMLKYLHRDYFKIRKISINGITVSVIGNIKLLGSKDKIQVRCSRKNNNDEINKLTKYFIDKASKGVVLVSPFISPGEKAIEKIALENHYCLIKIVNNGFPPLYKPSGIYFDLCSESKLLLVSSFEYKSTKTNLTKKQCEEMNLLALYICQQNYLQQQ
jgi:hypothetical protein